MTLPTNRPKASFCISGQRGWGAAVFSGPLWYACDPLGVPTVEFYNCLVYMPGAMMPPAGRCGNRIGDLSGPVAGKPAIGGHQNPRSF